MYPLSESRHNAHEKAKQIFTNGVNNSLYIKHRIRTIDANAFYEGRNHWPEELRRQLALSGVHDPIVVNKVKPFINQLCGLEINTRSKFAYRVHSMDENNKLLAKALTHIGYYVQEDQNFSYNTSLMARDSIICGIGWQRIYCYQGRYYLEYTDPLNVIYDADDNTPQFENMNFICSLRYLSNNQLKMLWPKFSKRFDEINNPDAYNNGSYLSTEILNKQNAYLSASFGDLGAGGRIPVIEVQHKIPKEYYSGMDRNGFTFETFDEEKAMKMADSKKDVEELMGTQIMRTVIYQDLLLEYSPLYPNIPNLTNFSYIPHVWSRDKSDSVPRGLIEDMRPVQMEINFRKQKELLFLNSSKAIIDSSAYPNMDLEDIRREIRRPDTILLKSPGQTTDIIPNAGQAAEHRAASIRNDQELQQVSGIFNDSLGEATNAQSGVAIKQRQIATAKNFASGFDSFKIVKKRQGKALVDLIQGGEGQNIYVQILDRNEEQELLLNMVKEVNGKEEIFNDIRTIPIDIYIENVPDYDSALEEQQATLESLLSNPQGLFILQNEPLLKLMNFRYSDQIASAMKEINQDKMAMEQAAQQGGARIAPGQAPPPSDINPVNVGS